MPVPRALRPVAAIVLLTLAYVALPPLFAGDPNFGEFVKRLERDYRLRRTPIPFLWLAKAVVWVAHPAGVKRVDLAIFEDQDFSFLIGAPELQGRVHSFLGPGWKPFVEVHAPRKGQRVLLYAREKDRDMEMFVFSVERDQAVAVLTRVNPEVLNRVIEDPHSAAKVFH